MNYVGALSQHAPHELAVCGHFAYRFKPIYYARKNFLTNIWISKYRAGACLRQQMLRNLSVPEIGNPELEWWGRLEVSGRGPPARHGPPVHVRRLGKALNPLQTLCS